MARGDKRIQLRTVDDEIPRNEEVVRLRNRETEPRLLVVPQDRPPVPVPVQAPDRLEIARGDEAELRTHQPGIEALIETDAANPLMTEDAWGGTADRPQPLPWGWFALVGILLVAGAAWSLSHLRESEVVAHTIRDETASSLANEEAEEAEARRLIERIEETLRIFFDSSSVDLLARMVRHPERVKPLMLEYHERAPIRQSPMESMRSLQPLTLEGRASFWIASVTLADDRRLNVVMEIDENGSPLIDWETMVCYQPKDWDEFVRNRPPGRSMDFRVVAERDHFHSHEFSDPGKWTSFRLSTLDGDETLFGYAPVGGEAERKMLELAANEQGGRMSLILRLGIPHGLQSRRGVVIEKVVSPRWIHVDPPDQES